MADLAWLAPAVYAVGWLTVARWWFQRVRPWTEPLACSGHLGAHSHWCYRRWGSIDSNGEAAFAAWLVGFAWWFLPVFFAVYWVIRAGAKPDRREVEAKTARLEREADRWRCGDRRTW
jgi:hypothetical protein